MIQFLLVALICGTSIVASASEAIQPPDQFSSGDGRYQVKILRTALPGADPVNGFYTLVVSRGGQVLAQFPTQGYLISAFWRNDARYVAINNRRANSGDYLWVISLIDGKALKAPDNIPGEVYADRATRQITGLSLNHFKKHFTVAKGWANNGELKVESALVFDNVNNSVVMRNATYKVKDDQLVLSQEDFIIVPSE